MPRIFLLIIFLCFSLIAKAEDFVAGKDYELVSSGDISPVSEGKIQIKEFFSYGCPWCFRIESALKAWVGQQNGIEFSRVPVVFNKDWLYYAKAYYTAKFLGLEEKLNPLLFKTIQSKQPMNSNYAMIDFFITHGVEPATAKSAFEHSTTLDMELNKATALMATYNINKVPSVVINNKYKTDLEMAKGEARLFKVLDFLIALQKKEISS